MLSYIDLVLRVRLRLVFLQHYQDLVYDVGYFPGWRDIGLPGYSERSTVGTLQDSQKVPSP